MKQSLSALLLLSCAHTGISHAQICKPSTSTNAADSHYLLKTDGTAFDKNTGLLWMRCALGQNWANNSCSGAPQLLQWNTALEMAKTMSFAGQKDWRLPTQEELQSLLESRCRNPVTDISAFPNLPPSSVYWSSTPIGGLNTNGAWTVNFYDGDDYWGYQSDYNAVRLTKAGCTNSDSDQDGVNDCLDLCPNSASGIKVDATGCASTIQLKGLQFDIVLFELDSDVLTANSKQLLNDVAKELINYSGKKTAIQVQGHTSNEASNAHNLNLSQRRAEAVAYYLKQQGVKDKLQAKGFGEDYPIADNSTEAGRTQNRRVELHWGSE